MSVFSGLRDLADDRADYRVFCTAGGADALGPVLAAAAAAAADWGDYIWQRESFALAAGEDEDTGRPILCGSTEYGECVDDEWLVVYLLRDLSRRFPATAIQIADTDGEFLLIEAANALPRWLSPDNAENRVWIVGGELCVVPAEPDGPIGRAAALDFVATRPAELYRPPLLQREAFGRLADYPAAARRFVHRAAVRLPRAAAGVLAADRQLVSAATEAFLLRDPGSMRLCRAMATFPPEDSVDWVVPLPRLQYAQLRAQRIAAPARFALPRPDAPGYAAAELGMKLACGLELLVREYGAGRRAQPRDVVRDPAYKRHLHVLRRDGFFAAAEPGTPAYQRLTERARELFLAARPGYSLAARAAAVERLLAAGATLSDADAAAAAAADSDSWMDLDYAEFERTLDGDAGPDVPDAAAAADIADAQDKVKSMVDRLRRFMDDDRAGLDGAEFDDELSSESEPEPEPAAKPRDPDAPPDDIDEDDFLEFFLQEALKLSPEEIAQYRAAPDSDADDEVDDILRQQLQDSGIVPDTDPDYAIAQNMLESFKSQAGAPGPAGNLLARLGIRLPRDDELSDDSDTEPASAAAKGKARA
ncbi:SGT1 protein-domain-containing protein [Dipodascopsis tothii]|uniref:SGT1 protein-domain-containing protein n=1 Tax=Dipodascopsis tothii TaxID=44089 RepID=UPI0034CD4443